MLANRKRDLPWTTSPYVTGHIPIKIKVPRRNACLSMPMLEFWFASITCTPLPLTLLYQIPSHQSKRTHLHPVFLGAFAARLSHGIPCGDSLHDNASAVDAKRLAPCQIWLWVPSCYLLIPFQTLLLCREPRCPIRQEHFTAPSDRSCLGRSRRRERCQKVAQVRKWVTYCRHFPATTESILPAQDQEQV